MFVHRSIVLVIAMFMVLALLGTSSSPSLMWAEASPADASLATLSEQIRQLVVEVRELKAAVQKLNERPTFVEEVSVVAEQAGHFIVRQSQQAGVVARRLASEHAPAFLATFDESTRNFPATFSGLSHTAYKFAASQLAQFDAQVSHFLRTNGVPPQYVQFATIGIIVAVLFVPAMLTIMVLIWFISNILCCGLCCSSNDQSDSADGHERTGRAKEPKHSATTPGTAQRHTRGH